MSYHSRSKILVLTASLSIATVFSATGLIYLLRPLRSGAPQIQDALPLDELAGHAQVDLLLFLAVWIMAGVVLCITIEATRTKVREALPVLAATLLLSSYMLAAVSIFVVRQIPPTNGLLTALATPTIYLATLLATLPSALHRAHRRRSR
jgi:hypothetical protein